MSYVPDSADIVWIRLDRSRGREQSGRRPFLVLSPRRYNEKTSLAVGCPITSRSKGYPFEVPLSTEGTEGVVLADHVRSIDWRGRRAAFIERASPRTDETTRTLIATLLRLPAR
ncbi:MAG TPA: endoribonuclease MazF [Candidatus Elarobacter sp.]